MQAYRLRTRRLGGRTRMRLSSSEEEGRVVAHALAPQRRDDAHPPVREGTQCNAMALALTPFAAIVRQRPFLLSRGLPSELVQGIAPWLDTGQTPARPRTLAAFIGDRRGPCQRLDTRCTPETLPVVAPS